MIPARRQSFNRAFDEGAYRALLGSLERRVGPIAFRISETPCFFPAALLRTFADRAIAMVRTLLDDERYRTQADDVVPDEFRLAQSEPEPTFVQVDFGLLATPGGLEGRLVELQSVIGHILQDEKFPGVHIAFGNPYGAHTGADWYSGTHIDVVGTQFDIWVDDRQIMREGSFLIAA